jgi:predicted metalloendopeptidase
LNKEIDNTILDVWKAYLLFHLIDSKADELGKVYSQLQFDFYSKALNNMQKMPNREKQMLNLIKMAFRDYFGSLYVTNFFSQESKRKAEEIANNIKKEYAQRIQNCEWTAETKQEALKKLNNLIMQIGFPKQFNDYNDLDIRDDSHYLNMCRLNEYYFNIDLKKLNQKINREAWEIPVHIPNAGYNYSTNQFKITAAFLEFPSFDKDAPDSYNYAIIGAVIAHEISHAFDDQGSKFDIDGNMRRWWAESDYKSFKVKTSQLISQYNKYTVLDSINVNGELTLAENIADLIGVSIAYSTFRKNNKFDLKRKFNGYTEDQWFFINYAQAAAVNYTKEELLKRIKYDTHAPKKYRVNGVLFNMPEFYDTFGIKRKHDIIRFF